MFKKGADIKARTALPKDRPSVLFHPEFQTLFRGVLLRSKKNERESRDSSPALFQKSAGAKFRFFPPSAQTIPLNLPLIKGENLPSADRGIYEGLKLNRCSFVFLCPSQRQLEQRDEERRVHAQFQLDDDEFQHERWLPCRLSADENPRPLHYACVEI